MTKLMKLCVLSFVLAGSFLSILNFIPPVQADVYHGTIITMTDPQILWDYYQQYGEQYMYDHWMHEDLKYCLEQASNCTVNPLV